MINRTIKRILYSTFSKYTSYFNRIKPIQIKYTIANRYKNNLL